MAVTMAGCGQFLVVMAVFCALHQFILYGSNCAPMGEYNQTLEKGAEVFDSNSNSEPAEFPRGGTWTGPIYRVSKPRKPAHYILGSPHVLGQWYTKNLAQAIPRFIKERDIGVVYTEKVHYQSRFPAVRRFVVKYVYPLCTYNFDHMMEASLPDLKIEWKGLETNRVCYLATRESEKQFSIGESEIPDECQYPSSYRTFMRTEQKKEEETIRAFKAGEDIVSIGAKQYQSEVNKRCERNQCPTCDWQFHTPVVWSEFRNQHWANELEAELRPSFVSCGNRHLYVGENNFLDILRTRGWDVEKYTKGLTIPDPSVISVIPPTNPEPLPILKRLQQGIRNLLNRESPPDTRDSACLAYGGA